MSKLDFGWELPPGVTHQMIEDAVGGDDEDPYCIDCNTDTTDMKDDFKCKECGITLCSVCYKSHHKMCGACLADA